MHPTEEDIDGREEDTDPIKTVLHRLAKNLMRHREKMKKKIRTKTKINKQTNHETINKQLKQHVVNQLRKINRAKKVQTAAMVTHHPKVDEDHDDDNDHENHEASQVMKSKSIAKVATMNNVEAHEAAAATETTTKATTDMVTHHAAMIKARDQSEAAADIAEIKENHAAAEEAVVKVDQAKEAAMVEKVAMVTTTEEEADIEDAETLEVDIAAAVVDLVDQKTLAIKKNKKKTGKFGPTGMYPYLSLPFVVLLIFVVL